MPAKISPPALSPVSLSYVAALRGVRPRAPGQKFAYASLGCGDIPGFMCMAASNPEGRFYCVIPDAGAVAGASRMAESRNVGNLKFISASITEILRAAEGVEAALPMLDYMVCDETSLPLTEALRNEVFTLAERKLRPGGLFSYSYCAWRDGESILRFLVSEFSPEMDVKQSLEFLQDMKSLGQKFFSTSTDAAVELERALSSGVPDEFFGAYDTGVKISSGIVSAMEGLLPRGFAYAGDACVSNNYMELSTLAGAHSVLSSCVSHVLYEPIKDFAIQRLVRHDVWCRMPAEQTENIAALFGGFTYGLTLSRDQVPMEICGEGKTIDISAAPFTGLIDLMAIMPITIGDFLEHSSGRGVAPGDALAAMQILIAGGIASPMRSSYQGRGTASLQQPRWSEAFNSYLNDEPIDSARVVLASSVVGSGVSVSARDALVMQALSRGGMADSAAHLFPELVRLSRNPALCSQIMDVAEPTPEMANNMIAETVQRSMPRWCAYGLMAA